MTKINRSTLAAATGYIAPLLSDWRLAGILAACLLFSLPGNAAEPNGQQDTVIFLVRHAEKTQTGADPALSEAGQIRASLLADLLAKEDIRHVHSTDYARTRQTAAPIANRLGIEVELYDPAGLPAFAEALRESGGRHLVVGHSNTTTQLVGLLGGEAGAPIDHNGENDRLYQVTVADSGEATTELSRYGEPFRP
jgi:broad specificity phosphatase PhoE